MLKISIGMEIKNKSILTNNNTKRLKWIVNGTEKTVLSENVTHLELDLSVSHFPEHWKFPHSQIVWVVTMCCKHRSALFGAENPEKHSLDL